MERPANISQEELELMERFWQGVFADEGEEYKLKERYKYDLLWREKADWVRLMILSIEEVAVEDKLNNLHKYLAEIRLIDRQQAKLRYTFWGLTACAVALPIGLFFLLFYKSADQKLFAEFYKPDPGLPTLMGVSQEYVFEKAMIDYKLGEYRAALAQWQTLRNNNQASDTLNYFIASALMADQEIKEALPFFEEVVSNPNSVFFDDAQWYKAMALLYVGEREQAIVLLQSTDHPNKDKLLQKIKD